MDQPKKKTYNLFALRDETDKKELIGTNDNAYNGSLYSNRSLRQKLKDYTKDEVMRIISSNDLNSQQRLSRNYFTKNGYYKQIITNYATLLKYVGILIPSPAIGQNLSNPTNVKHYKKAMNFVSNIPIKIFCENCAQKALVDGSYFGVIQTLDKNTFSFLDLPSEYCISRFKDVQGNDLIEFDLNYFNSITEEDSRQIALETYPEFISQAYDDWSKGRRKSKWILIPAEVGICFPMFDGHPYFLHVLPAILDYEEIIEIEKKRDLEEIKKIIVQHIPHNNDNVLLFEPDEAVEIHEGTVQMMHENDNVSVLTSYADVDSITSSTSSEASNNYVENMLNNIYSNAGLSSQLFSSNGSTTLSASIKKDIQLMMVLANKFSLFFTNIINRVYGNSNLRFKYEILPISEQNIDDYIKNAKELASLGYSWLIPAIAMDLDQKELSDIKALENNVLKLQDLLLPLQTSYTQSEDGSPGAPKKEDSKKAEQTIKNEKSKAAGGSKQ